MDLFTLDTQLRRIDVFDRYQSLIWAERFSDYGDFELRISSNNAVRSAFKPGTRCVINESDRIMVVETVKDRIDTDGRKYLEIKGPELVESFNDAVALDVSVLGTDDQKWYFDTMLPAAIVRQIFEDILVTGTVDPGDVLPFYVPGNLYPTDTIPEPADEVSLSIPPTTVYSAIKQVCDIYGLGFRLYRNDDAGELYFNVYAGSDRTTGQTTLPAVIFSPELDNLQDVSFLSSISGYKNVAYVIAPNGSMIVYGFGIDPGVAGFERKVLLVDASDITEPAGPTLNARLTQRGSEQLALNTSLAAFDGEVAKNSQFRYKRDYELGDLVEIRDSDKVANQMVVSEQIYVNDEQGFREYPTLTVKRLITPGSWLAEPTAEVWSDLTSPTDTWGSR